jgi:hypothetical protein
MTWLLLKVGKVVLWLIVTVKYMAFKKLHVFYTEVAGTGSIFIGIQPHSILACHFTLYHLKTPNFDEFHHTVKLFLVCQKISYPIHQQTSLTQLRKGQQHQKVLQILIFPLIIVTWRKFTTIKLYNTRIPTGLLTCIHTIIYNLKSVKVVQVLTYAHLKSIITTICEKEASIL